MVKVCENNIIFPCIRPSMRPSSIHLSVTLSPPKPRQNSTKLATSPLLMVRVWESNIFFSVHAPVHLSVLNNLAEFNQTCYITFRHHKDVREQNYFFRASVRLCIRRPSICSSRYLLLNHWAEFNQTCYLTFSHGKGVRMSVIHSCY